VPLNDEPLISIAPKKTMEFPLREPRPRAWLATQLTEPTPRVPGQGRVTHAGLGFDLRCA
jgi:hypothetical protein